MNKVFNWTVGSFFRTIGRMLAFFITGIAIAYILAQSDLKIGNIFRYTLGVHASSFEQSGFTYWYNTSGTSLYDGTSFARNNFIITSSTTRTYNYYFNSSKTGISVPSRAFYFTFNYFNIINIESNSQTTENVSTTCAINSNVTHPNAAGAMADDVEYEYNSLSCASRTTSSSTQTYTNNVVASARLVWSNGGFSSCYYHSCNNNYCQVNCPVVEGRNANLSIVAVQIINDIPTFTDNFTSINGVSYQYYFISDDTQDIINSQQQSTNAIEAQTQQDQQQHEEIMDSNTTQAEDDAQDFFETFDAPDIGGLSAIITAPLSTIQSLLNATCTNLVLPLPFVNENLTLPCMNDIYTQHFGAFFSLYQTIILGIIAYRCIRSIFFDLQGFANPSDDRIEVMDL